MAAGHEEQGSHHKGQLTTVLLIYMSSLHSDPCRILKSLEVLCGRDMLAIFCKEEVVIKLTGNDAHMNR